MTHPPLTKAELDRLQLRCDVAAELGDDEWSPKVLREVERRTNHARRTVRP